MSAESSVWLTDIVTLVEVSMLDILKHFKAFSKLTVYKNLKIGAWKVLLSRSSISVTGGIT